MTQERIKTTGRNAVAKITEAQKDLTWLNKFARELRKAHFYGSLLVKFENGKIVHVKKEESIKID